MLNEFYKCSVKPITDIMKSKQSEVAN